MKHKKICKNCKKKFEVYLSKNRKDRGYYCSQKCWGVSKRGKMGSIKKEYEYTLRIIKPDKNSVMYGISVPRYYVEKYKLLKKKFKIKISPYGKFMIYTKLNERQ